VRNYDFMKEVLSRLHINTRILFSSEMEHTEKSTELLLQLIKQTGSDVYMCGMGAAGYQDNALLNENGISIEYSNYQPKPYEQYASPGFVPGLSILDALMNMGFEETEYKLKAEEI
jgi:hypothetical protein